METGQRHRTRWDPLGNSYSNSDFRFQHRNNADGHYVPSPMNLNTSGYNYQNSNRLGHNVPSYNTVTLSGLHLDATTSNGSEGNASTQQQNKEHQQIGKNQNEASKYVSGAKESEKKIVFQIRRKYFHFALDDVYNLPMEFKINDDDKAYFKAILASFPGSKKSPRKNYHRFMSDISTRMDSWPGRKPGKIELLTVAKYIIVFASNIGNKAVKSVATNISKRMVGNSQNWRSADGNKIESRMILIYLIHFIVLIEKQCPPPGVAIGLFCKCFEAKLLEKEYFRNLVKEGDINQKQELYSLRYKWNSLFSHRTLQSIDRDFFWYQQGKGWTANYLTSEIIDIEDCGPGDLKSDDLHLDNPELVHATEIINHILSLDWLNGFPLNVEDKRRFTDKYSAASPIGKNGLMYCDKIVEFKTASLQFAFNSLLDSTEKEKIIETAKEVIFVGKVFGRTTAFSVAEILIIRMTAGGRSAFSLPQQLVILLVIHIVMVVEAKLSLVDKYQPMYERPFSRAFGTNAFVMNFKYIAENVKYTCIRKKLYYMRLVWENCLLKEVLGKIDEDNFWIKNGVRPSVLPTCYDLGMQCNDPGIVGNGEDILFVKSVDKSHKPNEEDNACIVLQSSDDEDDDLETEVRQIEINDSSLDLQSRHVDNGVNADEIETGNDKTVYEVRVVLNQEIKDEETAILETAWPVQLQDLVSYNEENDAINANNASRKKRKLESRRCITLIQKNRRKVWALDFKMDKQFIKSLWKKFESVEKKTSSQEAAVDDLKIAIITIFRKTVMNVFQSNQLINLLDAAMEAFFIEKEFGQGEEVAQFLVSGMQNGFSMSFQLISFLIIHIISAVESDESFISSYVTDKFYTKAFKKKQVSFPAKQMTDTITESTIKEKLYILRITWKFGVFKKLHVPKHFFAIFQNMCESDLEWDFIKDILQFAKELYESERQIIMRDNVFANMSKLQKRKHEEIESRVSENVPDNPNIDHDSPVEIEIAVRTERENNFLISHQVQHKRRRNDSEVIGIKPEQ